MAPASFHSTAVSYLLRDKSASLNKIVVSSEVDSEGATREKAVKICPTVLDRTQGPCSSETDCSTVFYLWGAAACMEMARFTEVQALRPVGDMASWKLEQRFRAAAHGLANQIFFAVAVQILLMLSSSLS